MFSQIIKPVKSYHIISFRSSVLVVDFWRIAETSKQKLMTHFVRGTQLMTGLHEQQASSQTHALINSQQRRSEKFTLY